jgi:hypothetical protein
MLTTQQLVHFETFGFVVLRQAFSADEMAAISRDFDEVLAEDRRGIAFPGDKRQAFIGFVEQRPTLTALVECDVVY